MANSQTSPESICCSLEIAENLKGAGWPQFPSLFYWDSHAINKTQGDYGITEDGEFAAPTCEEILRRLPDFEKGKEYKKALHIVRAEGTHEWDVHYCSEKSCKWGKCCKTLLLADAAALCWIYLKENNLLPPTV